MPTVVATLAVIAVLFAFALVLPGPRVPREAVKGRPRVIVLGGGFAGVYTAMYLEELGRGAVDVVLVSKENHFVFQPMLPEVISGTIGITDVVSPIHRLLPEAEIHVREVESIDLEARTV